MGVVVAGVIKEKKKQEPRNSEEASSVLSHSIMARLFSSTVCYSIVHLSGKLVNFFLEGHTVNILGFPSHTIFCHSQLCVCSTKAIDHL